MDAAVNIRPEASTRVPVAGAAAAAIAESMEALDGLGAGLAVDQHLARVFQLEDASWFQARKLGRDYLGSPRLDHAAELALWRSNYDWWWRLVLAYEECLRRYHAGAKGAREVQPWLGVLYARLLHAYVFCHKWARFRYGPMSDHLWFGAGRAYLGAVADRVAELELIAYPGAAIVTSPRREYLKALMLHTSSMDNLLPLEIEIAQQLISHFLPLVTFSEEPRHGNVFWVDAATAQAPVRLTRLPEAKPSLRFFSAGKTLKAVAELRQGMAESGQVPAELRLVGQYTVRSILPLLDHLAGYWSPSPPSRNHPRHRVKSRLTVVHGLAAIQCKLAAGDEEGEAWIADNVSREGIGATVTLEAKDWLRIGVLVGVQPEGGDNWLVGVVRRLSRMSEQAGLVGISTLGKLARPVLVHDESGAALAAILLAAPHLGERVQLLLERGAYAAASVLRLDLDGELLRLAPQQLVETGTDFALGAYRVETVSRVFAAPIWDERP